MNIFGFNPFTAISEFMNNFMNWNEGSITEVNSGRAGSVAVDPQAQCPHCGYQLSTFRQNGRLGCTKCYESFKAAMGPLISRIHGNVRHVEEGAGGVQPAEAKAPAGAKSKNPEVQALREKIDAAIKAEKYEEAARLRDEVKKLEEK
jgi:protein arginine kinase activator